MSGDPEQDYFADGMVEEITTVLSRVRWLFVAVDWVVGMPYLPGEPGTMSLTPEAALAPSALPHASLATRLKDALSWPRVRNLGVLVATA